MRKVPNPKPLDTTRKRRKPRSQKTPLPKAVSRYLWNPQKTLFWASRNLALTLRCEKSQTPSGHEPKTAKTRAKKLFHVTFGLHKNNLLGLAKSGLGPPLPKASNTKTQARKPRTAKHAAKLSRNQPRTQDTSPKASNSKTRSGLGALDAKKSWTPSRHEPKTAKTRSKKSCTLPLESKKILLGRKSTCPV